MSSQNILQQIKNSHSLLPVSRDPPPTPYAIALTKKFNKQKPLHPNSFNLSPIKEV
ncbi:hypothetical protein PN499_04065 [Kamptonema animale CS-326]|jgi:hypothetical protein|uniref:hypothetical protein n=1 Tax=Kamptonema animale TaxID=92934 RepID=UPI00232C9556|nr:hypothetical protein [Kamptonema animale]MDB9510377.1 hypothetical protein [Kamptonema animale CS-326]